MLREFRVDANVGKPQVAYRETIRKNGREGRAPLRPPDRWPGPVRPRGPQPGAHRPRRRLRVRRQDHRRRHPQGVHPRGRRRHPGRHAVRRARRLPGRRHAGHARLRLLPRRRLVGDGLQDRRLRCASRRPAGGPARCCSSRSWPSRSSRRRTTWATSSATCPPGAATSEAWSQRGNNQVVRAEVPLAEMFGYATDLRSRTQGRATYTMQFRSLPGSAGAGRQGDRRAGPR